MNKMPFLLLALLLLTGNASVRADSPARQASQFASGAGNLLYLAAGVGLPLLSDGRNGTRHSLRVVDSVLVASAVTYGLKELTREKRPDTDEHNSFPSGHATAAWAVAGTMGRLHPKQAGLWYLGATLISYSRVRLHRHYGRDVLAGAAIGLGASEVEGAQSHGLVLSPLITPDAHGAGMTVTIGL